MEVVDPKLLEDLAELNLSDDYIKNNFYTREDYKEYSLLDSTKTEEDFVKQIAEYNSSKILAIQVSREYVKVKKALAEKGIHYSNSPRFLRIFKVDVGDYPRLMQELFKKFGDPPFGESLKNYVTKHLGEELSNSIEKSFL